MSLMTSHAHPGQHNSVFELTLKFVVLISFSVTHTLHSTSYVKLHYWSVIMEVTVGVHIDDVYISMEKCLYLLLRLIMSGRFTEACY